MAVGSVGGGRPACARAQRHRAAIAQIGVRGDAEPTPHHHRAALIAVGIDEEQRAAAGLGQAAAARELAAIAALGAEGLVEGDIGIVQDIALQAGTVVPASVPVLTVVPPW